MSHFSTVDPKIFNLTFLSFDIKSTFLDANFRRIFLVSLGDIFDTLRGV